MDLCELEASLVYKASSRTARAVTQRNPVSKSKKRNKKGKGKRKKSFWLSMNKLFPTDAVACQFLASELLLKQVANQTMAEKRVKCINKYKVTYPGGPLF